VEAFALVLHERDLVVREERDVVEPGVGRIRLVEDRDVAAVGRRIGLDDLEDGAQPPQQSFSVLAAFVSPVSSKKYCWKWEPGRKRPFSGRLNGVARAAFAATLALNEAVPSAAGSWTVIQFVLKTLP
jgi:hypothetical protein